MSGTFMSQRVFIKKEQIVSGFFPCLHRFIIATNRLLCTKIVLFFCRDLTPSSHYKHSRVLQLTVFGVRAPNISIPREQRGRHPWESRSVCPDLHNIHTRTTALIYVLIFQPLSLPVNPIDWWSMKIHLEPKGSLLSLTFSLLYFIL